MSLNGDLLIANPNSESQNENQIALAFDNNWSHFKPERKRPVSCHIQPKTTA